MTEAEILKAWRASLKPGDRVRHRSDWTIGILIGESWHPQYDLDVDFGDPFGASCIYARNIFPEWWPVPKVEKVS